MYAAVSSHHGICGDVGRYATHLAVINSGWVFDPEELWPDRN